MVSLGRQVLSVPSLLRSSFPLSFPVKLVFCDSSSQILSGVMLEVLSEDFPEFFTADVQLAWSKLMAVVYWHVTGAYTDVGWLQVSSSAV